MRLGSHESCLTYTQFVVSSKLPDLYFSYLWNEKSFQCLLHNGIWGLTEIFHVKLSLQGLVHIILLINAAISVTTLCPRIVFLFFYLKISSAQEAKFFGGGCVKMVSPTELRVSCDESLWIFLTSFIIPLNLPYTFHYSYFSQPYPFTLPLSCSPHPNIL